MSVFIQEDAQTLRKIGYNVVVLVAVAIALIGVCMVVV